jgi:hypothetical protein
MLCGRQIPDQAKVLDIPDDLFDGEDMVECDRCRRIVEGTVQAAVVLMAGDTGTLRALWRLGGTGRPARILTERGVRNVSLQRFMPVLRGHEQQGTLVRLPDGRYALTTQGVQAATVRQWERDLHRRVLDDPSRAAWEHEQNRGHLADLDRYELDVAPTVAEHR